MRQKKTAISQCNETEHRLNIARGADDPPLQSEAATMESEQSAELAKGRFGLLVVRFETQRFL